MKKATLWTSPGLWALLGLIIYSPWPLGGFAPGAWQKLALGEGLIFVLFFVGRIFSGGSIRLPWMLSLCGIFLLAHGWFMTWNAEFSLNQLTGLLLPVTQSLPSLPGSLNRLASFHTMLSMTALIGISWVVADASADTGWRKKIVSVIAATGTILITFGIIQKIMGAHGFWPEYGRNIWPFASFFYHGNAGAFVNLIFPLVAALAWRAAFIDESPLWTAMWVTSLALCITGGLVNASKAALVVLLFEIAMVGIMTFRAMRKIKMTRHSVPSIALGVIVVLGAIALLTLSADIQQSISRWKQAYESREVILQGRMNVASICWKMSQEAGMIGFGPGTFDSLFPYAAAQHGGAPNGHWRFAHQDYLQTLVEWGWLSFCVWLLLFFGGVLVASFRGSWPRNGFRQRDKFLLLCIAISLAGCAAHAWVDFPLQVPVIQLYVAILLGLCWGSWQWLSDEEQPSCVSRRKLPPAATIREVPRFSSRSKT